MRKRPLDFLSYLILLQCFTYPLFLPLFNSSPLLPYCTLNLFVKRQTSFFSWPWTELTGQLRTLFGHSVALKDSLAEELLPDCFLDHGLIAATRFWFDPIWAQFICISSWLSTSVSPGSQTYLITWRVVGWGAWWTSMFLRMWTQKKKTRGPDVDHLHSGEANQGERSVWMTQV